MASGFSEGAAIAQDILFNLFKTNNITRGCYDCSAKFGRSAMVSVVHPSATSWVRWVLVEMDALVFSRVIQFIK